MIRRFLRKKSWWVLLLMINLGIFTLKMPYQARDDNGFYEWRSFVATPHFALHKELILPPLPDDLPYAYLEIDMFNAILPQGKTDYKHDIEIYIDTFLVAKFNKGQSLNKRIPIRREILENKNKVDVMVKVSGEPDIGLNHIIIWGDADAKTTRSYTVPPLPGGDLSLDPGIQRGEFGIRIISDYNLLLLKNRLALMLGATLLLTALKKNRIRLLLKKFEKVNKIPLFMSFFLCLYLISAILHMLFIYKFKDSCYLEPLYIIDAASYDGLAWDLANARNFLDWKDVMYASPGWSLVLALIYKVFGRDYLIAKSFLVLFAMIIGWIIFLLGKNLVNKRVGYFASLFYVFSTSTFYFAGVLQYETTLTLFVVLSIFFLVKSIMNDGWKRSVLIFFSGLVYGYTVLCKASVLPLVVLLPIWFKVNLKDWGRTIKLCLLFFLGNAFIITPWSIRNYYLHKEFILVTAGSGLAFYIGSNPEATGGYIPTRSLYADDMSPMESSQAFFKEGIQFAKEYPWRYISLGIKKMKLLWESPTDSFPFFHPILSKFTSSSFYCFYYSLLAIGSLLIMTDRGLLTKLSLLFMFLALFTFTHFFFVGASRYLIPFYPFLYLIQAVGLDYLVPNSQRENA